MSDAQANAVAEAAKTTGEIVKAAGGVGSYLARVFGSIPEDTLGLTVGDWLQHKRRRHLAALEANTARIIEGIDPERLSEPSPSVLIPLLQAAVDEGRPELQAMWSALLANAMVDGGRTVRRAYFETLRRMEATDALVLEVGSNLPNGGSGSNADMIREDIRFFDSEMERHHFTPVARLISINALRDLRCLEVDHSQPVKLSPYGAGLLAACHVR